MASPARDARLAAAVNGFTEIVERGRGHLRTRRPGTQKFALDTQVGGIGWHLPDGTEVDTAWTVTSDPQDAPYIRKMVLAEYNAKFGAGNLNLNSGMPFRYENPITGDYIQWQPAGQTLQWTNDLNQLSNVGLSTQQVAAQFPQDDTLYFPGAWGSGLDFSLELQTARLQKRIHIDTAGAIGSPPQFIIDGGNPTIMATFIFQRSPGVTVWLDGVQWAEGNGQGSARASVNHVEFRASDGTPLWYLSPARAWDSSTAQMVGPIRFRRQGGTYFIELRVPWSWLQTAVYPVTIDPTVDVDVSTGSDDASQADDGDGATLTSTVIHLRLNPGAGYHKYAGFRWNLSGPASGDTVDVCYVTVYFSVAGSINLDLDFQAADDPGTFTTATNDISGRTKTGNNVDWITSGTNFTDIQSPSLVTPAQAVIDRAGWASGQDIALILVGGQTGVGCSLWTIENSQPPSFHMEYTAGGGPVTVSLNTASIAASGQAASIVPGAVSKALNTAQVNSSGPQLTVDAPPPAINVAFNTAQVTAQGQASSIVPGAVSKVLNTAQIAAQGQASSVVPGAASVLLATAMIASSGEVISVVPGAVTILLAAGSIAAQGQVLTLSPGGVSIVLNTGQVSAQGQTITISAPAGGSVILDTALISAQGQALGVLPGSVSIALAAGQLTAEGQVLTVDAPFPGQSVSLASALVAAQEQALSVVPGAVIVALATATISVQGVAITLPAVVLVAAFGTVYRPNRVGSVYRPDRSGEVYRPNRAGSLVISDREG